MRRSARAYCRDERILTVTSVLLVRFHLCIHTCCDIGNERQLFTINDVRLRSLQLHCYAYVRVFRALRAGCKARNFCSDNNRAKIVSIHIQKQHYVLTSYDFHGRDNCSSRVARTR